MYYNKNIKYTFPLPKRSTVSNQPATAPGTLTLSALSIGIREHPLSSEIPFFFKLSKVSLPGDLPLLIRCLYTE